MGCRWNMICMTSPMEAAPFHHKLQDIVLIALSIVTTTLVSQILWER